MSVKFLTYLMGLNVPTLKTIASRVGHFVPENSKQRLASGILQKVTRPESLRTVIEDLSEHAHLLLRFVFSRTKDDWHWADFASFQEVWTEPELHQALSELVHSGLIGTTYDSSGHSHDYFRFHENLDLIRAILEVESVQTELRPVSAPTTVHASPHAWRTDLVTLLGYMIRNEIQITKQNLPHRRDLKALQPLLVGAKFEQLYKRLTQRDLDWVGRMQIWLREAGVVDLSGSALIPKKDALDRFLQRFGEDWEHHSFAAGLGAEERGSQNDAKATLEILLTTPTQGEDWYSLEALENRIYPVGEIFSGGGRPTTVRSFLFGLLLTGEIELGEGTEGWCWRRRARMEETASEIGGHLHVQPNFEIIASTALPLRDRCVLEQIAELTGIDHQLLHYKITRDSVYSGLCKGWSAQRQIEWYMSGMGGKRPLAQNVLHSIESWGQAFGRVSLEQPLLLVCDSEELAEQLYHSKEIAPYCLGRFTGRTLIMRKTASDEILVALQKMGLLPSPEIGGGQRWALEVKPDP